MSRAAGKRNFERAGWLERARKALKLIEQGYAHSAVAERFGVKKNELTRMLNQARDELKRKEPTQ